MSLSKKYRSYQKVTLIVDNQEIKTTISDQKVEQIKKDQQAFNEYQRLVSQGEASLQAISNVAEKFSLCERQVFRIIGKMR